MNTNENSTREVELEKFINWNKQSGQHEAKSQLEQETPLNYSTVLKGVAPAGKKYVSQILQFLRSWVV